MKKSSQEIINTIKICTDKIIETSLLFIGNVLIFLNSLCKVLTEEVTNII